MMFVAFGGRLNWVGCILVDGFKKVATLACLSSLTNFSFKRNAGVWREMYIREIYGILHQLLCTVFVWPTVQWKITCKLSRQSCQCCAVRDLLHLQNLLKLFPSLLAETIKMSVSLVQRLLSRSQVQFGGVQLLPRLLQSSHQLLQLFKTYKHTFKPKTAFWDTM